MALRDSLPVEGTRPYSVQMDDFADDTEALIDVRAAAAVAPLEARLTTAEAEIDGLAEGVIPELTDAGMASVLAAGGEFASEISAKIAAATGSVFLEDFDTSDFGAALAAATAEAEGRMIELAAGKTYLAGTTAVLSTGTPINFNGARVLRADGAGNVPVVNFTVPFGTVAAVTSITQENYVYESGKTTPVHVLNVADSTGFARDNRVKVLSDNILPHAVPSTGEKMGEIATILAVAPGKIYLRRLLTFDFTLNVRVARLGDPGNPSWYEPWFEDENYAGSGRSQPMIMMTGVAEPKLWRPRMINVRGEAFRLVSCFRPWTRDASGTRLKTDAANAAYGYLIRETGGTTEGRHEGITGDDARHLYTTGATDNLPDNSPQIANYGGAVAPAVKGGWGGETTSAAFDLHPDAINATLSGLTTTRSFQDEVGELYAHQLRGAQHTLADSESRVRGVSATGTGTTGGEFTITNHTHHAPAFYTGITAHRLNFATMATRGKVRLDGRTIGSKCSGYIEWYTKADVYIPFLEISIDQPLNNFRPFVLSDSRVYIDTLVVNGMPAGEIAPIFTLQDAASSVHVRNLRVNAGTTWRIANLGGFDGSVTVDNLVADTTPNDSATAGMQNAGSGATYWVKDGVIAGTQVRDGITTRTDGTATSTLTAFAGRTIRLSAPLTATRTLTLPVGVPVGTEVLVVRAAGATGAFNWQVQTAATVLEAERTWVRMKLLGANWATISRGSLGATPETLTGTTTPTSTPAVVGQQFIDTAAKKVYVAAGTASSADWVAVN